MDDDPSAEPGLGDRGAPGPHEMSSCWATAWYAAALCGRSLRGTPLMSRSSVSRRSSACPNARFCTSSLRIESSSVFSLSCVY